MQRELKRRITETEALLVRSEQIKEEAARHSDRLAAELEGLIAELNAETVRRAATPRGLARNEFSKTGEGRRSARAGVPS